MLNLEIEYLTGVCFAAQSQSSEQPDWPPQPDRVFSALVAAWGSRGESLAEKRALEWLEQQPAPRIFASDHTARRVGISFVPPNDARGEIEVMPDRRKRQARMFPAALPHHPLVQFTWMEHPDTPALEALQALARDTSYLGHSASVVRCRFTLRTQQESREQPRSAARHVYSGRLAVLEEFYHRGDRPPRGEAITIESLNEHEDSPCSIFSENWILLEDGGGDCPDARGIAVIARQLRKALLSKYGSDEIPEVISGHLPEGAPTSQPHLAIVPLIDAGWQFSSGRLKGLALVLPHDADQQRLTAERDWLAGLEDEAGTIVQWRKFDRLLSSIQTLKLGRLGEWAINRTLSPTAASMKPARYTKAAKRWGSVTPIALDRHPKAKRPVDREQQIAEMIGASCMNIGLPSPRRVLVDKHSSVKGAPSAYPSGSAPEWTGWTLTGSLANRVLTHAVIEFNEEVRGPVLLGAGRFLGLGLCVGDLR